jgi:hypothetical protein
VVLPLLLLLLLLLLLAELVLLPLSLLKTVMEFADGQRATTGLAMAGLWRGERARDPASLI